MNKPEIKLRKTYEIRFTKYELLHLRDLMSISLPPEGKQTISNSLATLENRQMIESMLWQKLVNACQEVGLPTGDSAPDYVIAPTGMSPLGVFQLANEPSDNDEDDDDDEDDDEDGVTNSLFPKKE
jgi:hypothetical protein